jgi:hypothetical protein
MGNLELQENRFPQAQEIFEHILSSDPLNAEALMRLSEISLAAENEEIAKIDLFRVFGQGADKTAKFEKTLLARFFCANTRSSFV